MAPFFQKRLRCFYCGRHSKQVWENTLRLWHCDGCQAANYLDENGEITDPPVAEVSSASQFHQYALPLSHSSGADQNYSDPTIFCATCQKNQYLFTQNLASYLPAQSHPDYETYEASYPLYKKNLEERYPQVCEKCQPRVLERIQQAGYTAKTDHLRRMMERSKGGLSSRGKGKAWKWKGLLVSMGAIAFWTSVAGQLVWNCVESAASFYQLQRPEPLILISSYFFENWDVPREWTSMLRPFAGMSLISGALSLWWNPKLWLKVDGHHGRIIGLQEYYRIQIVSLMVRFMAWAALQDPAIIGLHPNLQPSIHVAVGVFTSIALILSKATIKFEKKPLVNWNDSVDNLLGNAGRNATKQLESPPESQSSQLNGQPGFQKFPISSLAPHRVPNPEPFVPPTPPLDPLDDADAMDWTPSKQSLQPIARPSTNEKTQAVPTSSLFQGQLPPAPKPPSWQLRNPDPGQTARIMESRPNPFHHAPILKPTLSNAEDTQSISGVPDMVLAAPKFFPQSDLSAETGLENLFNKAFSIADGPSNVQMQHSSLKNGNRKSSDFGNMPLHLLKVVLLLFSIGLWTSTQFYSVPTKTVENVIVGVAFLVAGFSLLESLMRPMAVWSVTDILISLFELVSCIYIAVLRTYNINGLVKYEGADIYLMTFMMGQELFSLALLVIVRRPTIATRDPRPPNVERRMDSTLPPPSIDASKISFTPRSPIQGDTSFKGLDQSRATRSKHTTASNKNGPKHGQASVFSSKKNRNNLANFQDQNRQLQQPSFPPTAAYPTSPPLSQSQTLSFSPSFHSALQDRPSSPTSTASVSSTGYTSSVVSEQHSPVIRPRRLNASRTAPSPSILKTLSLGDRPAAPAISRYSLRSRRN